MSGVEAVAWIRFCIDGLYEGPIHDCQIDDVRRRSGVWTPLVPKPDYETLRAQLEAAEESVERWKTASMAQSEAAHVAEARAEAAEAECARIGEHAQIGRSVERACKELPEGAEVSIFLEKHSVWVEVTDWDGNQIEVQPRDTFAETINAAIDAARTKEETK